MADVWATVEESAAGVEERADKQVFGSSARFKVRYAKAYTLARAIEWRGQTYRVTSAEVNREGQQMLSFNTRLIEGGLL